MRSFNPVFNPVFNQVFNQVLFGLAVSTRSMR